MGKPVYGRVYLITNTVNSKVYVGQTTQSITRRWYRHIQMAKGGSTQAISRAIRKYGPSHFTRLELEECEDLEVLNASETRWIHRYKSLAPSGYNLTTGGDRGYEFTKEVKRHLSVVRGGLTENKEAAIIAAYKSGESAPKLGSDYGVDKTTIWNVLKRNGVPRRITVKANMGITRDQELEIIQKYGSGVSTPKLGSEYGVDHSAICKILKRNGVSMRSNTEANGGLPLDKELEVVRAYELGTSGPKLGIEYRVTESTVCEVLKRHRVRRRTFTEANLLRYHGLTATPPSHEVI